MRYPAKIYARALADFLQQPEEKDAKLADNFLKLLTRNNDLKKTDAILSIARKIYLKRTGNKYIVFETARKMSPKNENLLMSLAKKGDIVEEKISPEIIAGIKVVIDNEKQFDASVIKKIKKLFL